MLRSRWLAPLLLGWLALFASASQRTSAAPSSCALLNVTSVDFGSYNIRRDDPLDSVATVLYRCSGVSAGDRVRMELSRGGSRSFQRFMEVRSSRLRYNLYLDASHSVIWGDGTSGTGFYQGRPIENTTLTVSVYGRIPPRQNVRAGRYNDQLNLTVLY